MATTIDTNYTSTTYAETATNPDSILGKDDFMQLLLTELQHQDPTDPMDSDKILSQTSELAALEAQDNTNKALEELTASFKQNKDFAAVDTIGKYARLENKVNLKQDTDGAPVPVSFELNFDEDIASGEIAIYDEDNRLVKTMELKEDTKGKHAFTWDGLTNSGEPAISGEYSIYANYYNPDGVALSGEFSSYKVESVKFDNSQTYLKLNGSYISFDKIQEIYE